MKYILNAPEKIFLKINAEKIEPIRLSEQEAKIIILLSDNKFRTYKELFNFMKMSKNSIITNIYNIRRKIPELEINVEYDKGIVIINEILIDY